MRRQKKKALFSRLSLPPFHIYASKTCSLVEGQKLIFFLKSGTNKIFLKLKAFDSNFKSIVLAPFTEQKYLCPIKAVGN